MSTNGEGGGGGGGGHGEGGDRNCSRSGEVEVEGEGEGDNGVVFPRARPLRVFVSQGDVVYIDEVEAVAIRGGDDDAAATVEEEDAAGAAAAAAKRHTCGEQNTGVNGTATGKSDGQTMAPPGASVPAAVKGGEGSTPAFFDPLLNPGSTGGQNQQGKAWSSAVLLLVPLRLGLDELSAGYIPSESHYAKVRRTHARWGPGGCTV